jgi:hypothetical protein
MKENTNLESVPAGLLFVADFAARVPERAMDVVERERQHKQLLLLSIHQMKKTYSWNPGRTVWIALLIGLTVGTSMWSMSTVMSMFNTSGLSFGGVLNQYQQLGIEIPATVGSQVGSAVSAMDALPKFGMGDTIAFTIGSMIIYGIIKFLLVMPNLDRLRLLEEEEKKLEEEIRFMNGWMNDLIQNRTKK